MFSFQTGIWKHLLHEHLIRLLHDYGPIYIYNYSIVNFLKIEITTRYLKICNGQLSNKLKFEQDMKVKLRHINKRKENQKCQLQNFTVNAPY